ncbi:MAG: ABC transporter permease [Bacillales bacterium]
MKNIKIIFLKELKRIFTDKRMLLALFLPGLLIFIIYTSMGNLMKKVAISNNVLENTTYHIAYTDNFSNDKNKKEPILLTYLENYIKSENSKETSNKLNKIRITRNSSGEIDENDINKLKEGKYSLILSFSDDFEENIYDPEKITTTNLNYIYDGENKISNHIHLLTKSLFNPAYSKAYYSLSDKNISTGNYMLNRISSTIIPMLTISLLYSSVISICPESFAGEKERGTLANLLLTPIRRTELISGKVLALALTAIVSGLFSFIGMISSFPKMIADTHLSFSFISMLLILLVIISTLILFVTFGTFISSLAKTTKEAISYLGPFSIIFMLLAILPSLIKTSSIQYSFIPFINVSLCISNIIMGNGLAPLFLLITILVNSLLTGMMIFLTTKIFKNEKFII